jgi:hypothetical protein
MFRHHPKSPEKRPHPHLPKMGRRSKRLTEAIMDTATNLSSVAAAKTLKQRTADVGKSTICRLLKKELQNQQDKR